MIEDVAVIATRPPIVYARANVFKAGSKPDKFIFKFLLPLPLTAIDVTLIYVVANVQAVH